MHKLKIITFSLLALLLIKCGDQPGKDLEVLHLKPTVKRDFVGDSIYFSQILDIVHINDEKYTLVDFLTNNIIIVDEKLNLEKFAKKGGRGPSEFAGIPIVTYANEKLYIVDDGGSRVNIFSTDLTYLNEYKLPVRPALWEIAVDRNERVYYTPAQSDSLPIIRSDSTNAVYRFGKMTRYLEKYLSNKFHNTRSLFLKDNKTLIAFGHAFPLSP